MMKKRKIIPGILVIIFFQLLNTVVDGKNSVKNVPILGGRYFIDVPVNAVVEGRGYNIKEANPFAERETRIIIDTRKERFVVFATELFRYSDKNIFNEIDKAYNSAEKKYKFESSLSKKKNRIIFGWPFNEKCDNDDNEKKYLLMEAFIEGSDNILIHVGFYVNEAAYANNRQKYIKSAKKIIESVEQGDKKLSLEKSTFSLYTINITSKNRESIELTKPENYVLIKYYHPEFIVYSMLELAGFSDENNSCIRIYVGFDPSYTHPDYGFKINDARKISSTFLNRSMEWLVFEKKQNDKISFILSEAIVHMHDRVDTESYHIFILSKNYEQMKIHHEIVQNISIK